MEGEDIALFDKAGNRYDLAGRKAVSLFCEGSYVKVGFAAESTAFSLPPPAPKP